MFDHPSDGVASNSIGIMGNGNNNRSDSKQQQQQQQHVGQNSVEHTERHHSLLEANSFGYAANNNVGGGAGLFDAGAPQPLTPDTNSSAHFDSQF
jgi:hypothetical protein